MPSVRPATKVLEVIAGPHEPTRFGVQCVYVELSG
jgi:hypothetical protein